jgi:hypothetical protein
VVELVSQEGLSCTECVSAHSHYFNLLQRPWVNKGGRAVLQARLIKCDYWKDDVHPSAAFRISPRIGITSGP